ncbi:MAG: hypothetical protein KIS62_09925 [Ramlibacter sp.]|nr:hypothetical protein [Ramlibacter sp.]
MSFSTYLEVQYIDGQIDVNAIEGNLTELLNEDRIHLDVLNDLRLAFGGEETMFNVAASYLSYLVERIAGLQPTVSFHARGRGEELRDVWVREFEGGKAVFSEGSFL